LQIVALSMRLMLHAQVLAGDLSGGNKRKLSFAIAMLASPQVCAGVAADVACLSSSFAFSAAAAVAAAAISAQI